MAGITPLDTVVAGGRTIAPHLLRRTSVARASSQLLRACLAVHGARQGHHLAAGLYVCMCVSVRVLYAFHDDMFSLRSLLHVSTSPSLSVSLHPFLAIPSHCLAPIPTHLLVLLLLSYAEALTNQRKVLSG